MEMLYERCCGLDVHKRTVVACLLTPGADGQPSKEIRTFGTMTADLLALSDWLAAAGCTHVAMEAPASTGSRSTTCWRTASRCLVVNAAHIKAVPGRKTDVQGCRVDRRPVAPWPAARQLRPGSAAARAAGADALSHDPGPRARRRGQPAAEGAGRGQHQAGLGGDRYPGQVGPRHPGGAGRRERPTRRRWPSWPAGGCARRSRSWSRRWPASSARISASWSPSNWPTSTSSMPVWSG